ncbi:hypothetical protein HYV74_02780, partial [Candidatus Uhrbacteria bacterium]|nr:hypothetical protein [Candidatus Uhrbacteria bacterium]
DAWREGDADGFRELLRVATTVFPSGMERVAHALGLGQVTLRAWIQDRRASIPKKSGRLARMIGLVRAAAERDLAHRDDAGTLSQAL